MATTNKNKDNTKSNTKQNITISNQINIPTSPSQSMVNKESQINSNKIAENEEKVEKTTQLSKPKHSKQNNSLSTTNTNTNSTANIPSGCVSDKNQDSSRAENITDTDAENNNTETKQYSSTLLNKSEVGKIPQGKKLSFVSPKSSSSKDNSKFGRASVGNKQSPEMNSSIDVKNNEKCDIQNENQLLNGGTNENDNSKSKSNTKENYYIGIDVQSPSIKPEEKSQLKPKSQDKKENVPSKQIDQNTNNRTPINLNNNLNLEKEEENCDLKTPLLRTTQETEEPPKNSESKVSKNNSDHSSTQLSSKKTTLSKNNLLGALLMIAQAFLLASVYLYQRFVFSYYPTLTFGKTNLSIGLCLSLVTFLLGRAENLAFSYTNPPNTNLLLCGRVLTSFLGESLMFLATKSARISTLSCIMITYPITSCILIGLILKEKTSLSDYVYFASCCLGSILVIKPFSGAGEDSTSGIFVGIASTLIFSFTILFNSIICKTTHHIVVNFYTGVCFLLFGVVLCWFEGGWAGFAVSPIEAVVVLGVGVIYTAIRFLFNFALVVGEIRYILAFDNFTTVFCAIFGYYFLGDGFDYLDAIGTAVILGVCLLKSVNY